MKKIGIGVCIVTLIICDIGTILAAIGQFCQFCRMIGYGCWLIYYSFYQMD